MNPDAWPARWPAGVDAGGLCDPPCPVCDHLYDIYRAALAIAVLLEQDVTPVGQAPLSAFSRNRSEGGSR